MPPGVHVADAAADDVPTSLHAIEDDAVSVAVPKRRQEFSLGRSCAREALARLGAPGVAIPVGDGRAPVWPRGVVGSITHGGGYVAAAVAWACDIAALGVDAEPEVPLPAGLIDAVALAEEQRWIEEQADPTWGRVLFSAKESVYKAWYPLTRCWLGFEDVVVTFDRAAGIFTAHLREPVPPGVPATFGGRFRKGGGLILTAVTVVARDGTDGTGG